MKKIIDKTYLTKSGKNIRNCKMPGTYSINISKKNEKVANNIIESSEKRNITAVQYGNNAYAKQLIRKR